MLNRNLILSRKTFEEFCRREAKIISAPWGEVMCKILGEELLMVDTNDDSLAPNLIRDGYWEAWISVAMAREFREGMNCLDIGAHFGYYTILMARGVGETGWVMSCEPIYDYSLLIGKSARLNALNNIEICHQAITDEIEQIVELRSPGRNTGSTSMVLWYNPLVAEFYDMEGFKSYTNTIDNLCSEWEHVDIVKIDVEGAEDKVWYGMKETIRKNENIAIFLEYSSFRYEDESFLDDIINEGFNLAVVDTDATIKRVNKEYLRGKELEMLALRRNLGAWTVADQGI